MTVPERIWARGSDGHCYVCFDTPSLDYKHEYLRADLAPDARAIREAALREAAEALVNDVRPVAAEFVLALIDKEPK